MRLLFPLALAALALSSPILVQDEDSYMLRFPYWGERVQQSLALPGDDSKCIYDILKADDQFTIITKAIEFTETVDLYKDSSKSLTFFAPPNKAFPKPPHHGGEEGDDEPESFLSADPGALSLDVIMSRVETLGTPGHGDDDKDKERRRKILKEIARAVLAYHTLSDALDSTTLSVNTTQPTTLSLPKQINYAQPLRIKFSAVGFKPSLRLNVITRVVEADVPASNGKIHVISFPLIPPFPAFAELFQGPSVFSTFTSAIQRTRLADELDIRYVHAKENNGHGEFVGARAVTVFAPSNKAWHHLPKKLQLFLFSPPGTPVLRKLLQFHIVPDTVIHSDHLFEASSLSGGDNLLTPKPDPIYDVKGSFPTLLKDHSVEVHVTKYNATIPIPGPRPLPPHVITKFEVDGRAVGLSDIPAANGAIHIIGHVLNPRGHCDHPDKLYTSRKSLFKIFGDSDNSWDDWEDWLVDWANQA